MKQSAVVVCVAFLLFSVQNAISKTWILDESGAGDATTLSGLSGIAAGDIIQFRGTFGAEQQVLNNVVGAAGNPITLTSYPGTTAIIDGSGYALSSGGVLQLNNCNYFVVKGLEVRNSARAGISLYQTDNVLIQNNTVHDIQYRGIGGCGSHVTVTENKVYRAVLQNSGRSTNGGWSQAVSCDNCDNGDVLVQDWTFSKNIIYNSYGEGIDCIQVAGCLVKENVIYDTFSVNIYMDNARDVVVDSNYAYSSNSEYYRNGKPATGILVGAETWPSVPVPTVNATIVNNLLVNTGGIHSYQENSNYVTQVKIYYNTVWNNDASATFLWPIQPTTPSGNEMRNNIFWAKDTYSCYLPGQRSSWTFSNNVWVGVDMVPENCTDTTGSTSVAVANYTDIGFTGNADAVAAYDTVFTLLGTSPARGVATQLAIYGYDYFGSSRGGSPSAGFAEYGTNTASSRGNGNQGGYTSNNPSSSSGSPPCRHGKVFYTCNCRES